METAAYSEGIIEISYKSGIAYETSNTEHWHETYEMYYLITGSKTFYVDGVPYQLRSGDVMYIPPNIPHRSKWDEGGMLSNRIVTLYDETFIKTAVNFANSSNINELLSNKAQVISLPTAARSQFEILLKSLNDELSNDKPDYICLARMYLLQLLICLARNGITDEKAKKNKKDRGNIANIVNYIDKNFNKKITLESLSSSFFMNQCALSRSFNAVVGVSVISYINLKRVEKAKELLEIQDCSINSMSEQLGFNTTTYFEKVFKKVTGLTPTEYKKHLVEK